MACNAPVLHSNAKLNDGSGHAAFTVSVEDESVMLERTYTEEGTEINSLVCATCQSKLGRVSDIELRSAKDLEEGTRFNTVHVHSEAVVLKKSFTVKNYPFIYLIILCALGVGGYFAFMWGNSMRDAAEYGYLDDSLKLWVADSEVQATVVHLGSIDASTQSMVFGNEAMFVVFSDSEDSPQLKLPEESVDVIWMNERFEVVLVEEDLVYDFSESREVFTQPSGAIFALITKPMLLPTDTIQTGDVVIVLNKTGLL